MTTVITVVNILDIIIVIEMVVTATVCIAGYLTVNETNTVTCVHTVICCFCYTFMIIVLDNISVTGNLMQSYAVCNKIDMRNK